MKKKYQASVVAVIVLGLAVSLAACGETARENSGPYTSKGYEMGNSNPNLNTSPTHYNYRGVMKLAKQVLAEIDEVKGSTIFVDGAMMRATLHLEKGLNEQQKTRVEQRADKLLNDSFPVFKIKVKSKAE